MGKKETIGLWVKTIKQAASTIKAASKVEEVHQGKYNPLCEFVLVSEGAERRFIMSANTRAAARTVKREYQADKGVKVKILRYFYSSDRMNGGYIVDVKEVS
jgi:hypothetical protein